MAFSFFSPYVSFLGFAALVPALWLAGYLHKQKKPGPAERALALEQKKELYKKTLSLLQAYVHQIHELATEYRYIFNHSDSLTEENETKVEEMIEELEHMEAQIKQVIPGIAGPIAGGLNKKTATFFLKGNKRHLTSRDLLQHVEKTRYVLDELAKLMQDDLQQEETLLKSDL